MSTKSEKRAAIKSGLSMFALNQAQAAHVLGVDERTFQRWISRGCPGQPRRYPLRDCIAWARENAWSEEAVLIEGATGEDDDIKTQYLRKRIEKIDRENQLADFKIGERSENLVDVIEVEQLLAKHASVFRAGLEKLERKHGREALDLVLELMDEVESIDFSGVGKP